MENIALDKIKIQLGSVQETLLIPLFGRAESTRQRSGLINDPIAVTIVNRLDYDFSKWQSAFGLVGSNIRTRMMDEEVATFLSRYPDGTVIEIGCGLNTRYERLDNGRARWIEIDLPDSMKLRRQFFNNTARRTMLSASVMETDWLNAVAKARPPYCFISEAAMIYLDNHQVQQAIEQIGQRFSGAWFITDTASSTMVVRQDQHDIMKNMSRESWFRWQCDEPESLRDWGLRLVQSRHFLQAPKAILTSLPWPYRWVFKYLPWLIRRRLEGYKINRFVFR
ncbi:class I SAM-dependent methyltransferase [Gynuella sunshinyii]|uniref:O-Methyltransferase involved in polyketide biosynthesis n=1 Tax=Gynuella sunshinyii YC6258 TaxID=1445510 RepID=A0A0C5VN02_9GAMM|nr:class I SAM-dependent methyltransferase [Gynuella sunshinyii]AJQ96102.1 O-Methyltransferase involved in polyketide biosynthesis [Gynuella sunshinyii YC6258]